MILYNDNWIEIMKNLNFSLIHFALTNKYFYNLYNQNKKILCDEEHYQFTHVQKSIHQHILNHLQYDNSVSIPSALSSNLLPTLPSTLNYSRSCLISTNHHRGIKSSILSASLYLNINLNTSIHIITSKFELYDWEEAINKLYYKNPMKRNRIRIIYPTDKHVSEKYTNNKIIITSDIKPHHNNTHSPNPNPYLIFYKTDYKTSSHQDILFVPYTEKSKYQVFNPTNNIYDYPDNPILIDIKHYECYNTSSKYLDAKFCQLTMQHERLKALINRLIQSHAGPYLIIDSFIDHHVIDLYKCKNVHDEFNESDIVCTYNTQLINSVGVLDRVRTVIYLWPAHDKEYNNVMEVIECGCRYNGKNSNNRYDNCKNENENDLTLLHVHSTIEEAFLLKSYTFLNMRLDVKFAASPRGKVDYLKHIRKLLKTHTYEQLVSVDDQYFRLLYMVNKSEYGKIEELIRLQILK